LLHPGSVRLKGHKVALPYDAEQVREQQVAIISGGGSGWLGRDGLGPYPVGTTGLSQRAPQYSPTVHYASERLPLSDSLEIPVFPDFPA